jgi:hypothetical protein
MEGVMKTLRRLSVAMVIGLTLAGVVHAAPTPDVQVMPPGGSSVIPSEPRSAEDPSDSERVVTGRVLKVDADEGTIVIQTPMGVIALRGPSEDLRDVNVGDIVQVEMVGGEDYPSASPPMDPRDENESAR